MPKSDYNISRNGKKSNLFVKKTGAKGGLRFFKKFHSKLNISTLRRIHAPVAAAGFPEMDFTKGIPVSSRASDISFREPVRTTVRTLPPPAIESPRSAKISLAIPHWSQTASPFLSAFHHLSLYGVILYYYDNLHISVSPGAYFPDPRAERKGSEKSSYKRNAPQPQEAVRPFFTPVIK